MFDHPGKQLKDFGVFIFLIMVIAATIIGYLIGAPADHGLIGAGIGAVIGITIGWLSTIVLIAFGELVENTTRIRELMEEDDDNDEHEETQETIQKPIEQPNTLVSQQNHEKHVCDKCGSKNEVDLKFY